MVRSAKILQKFYFATREIAMYTCRKNLTQSQISDFFNLNSSFVTILNDPSFFLTVKFFIFFNGIERPFYRFSPMYGFPGLFLTVLARICFGIWEKLLSQHFFGDFLDMSR